MFLYILMAIYAGIGWAFNARLSSMMASSISVTGAMFTFLSLVTGAFGENQPGERGGSGTHE
jgi:heme exporter protein C